MHKVITGFRQLMPKLVILIIIFILFSCSNDDIDVNQVSEESGDLKIYTPSPSDKMKFYDPEPRLNVYIQVIQRPGHCINGLGLY